MTRATVEIVRHSSQRKAPPGPQFSREAKRLLRAIRNSLDEAGLCEAGVSALADLAQVAPSAADKALRELQGHGMIRRFESKPGRTATEILIKPGKA
jgi:DNA-binding MarR family transcriptional regulator